jgi:hypothetical protein
LQQIPKDPHEGEYPIVFESMYRLLERPLIEGAGAMGLKIPPFFKARGAEVAFSRGIGETAARAIGRGYRPDSFLTIRTNDQVFPLHADGGLTDRTNPRENKV